MVSKRSKKRYNVAGGLPLHDARRLLGLPIIAHTGRVNMYARCLGGKLRPARSVAEAQGIMKSSVPACGGIAGGKKKTRVRKDGSLYTAPR